MVSDLNRSKNFSKMKSPKSNNRSKRNKLSMTKDQRTKSLTKEQQTENSERDTIIDRKIKSGIWKPRTTYPQDLPYNSKLDPSGSAFPSLSITKSQPAVLYSDVLFSGEKLKTPVKIKNLTPRHSVKLNSRSRKRLISVERTTNGKSKENNRRLRIASVKPDEAPRILNDVPKSSTELGECVDKLMKRLNINIHPWNFEDYGKLEDCQEFINRFDDYNYLACENVALVGLRLATDGKFGF